ncbi:hypothetical protein [Methylorubrum extorquens]|uniref:Uncharacterized protein n=1 Tax=Methylorubrum extorquens (strain ATCC 14718 / DSM 1338 / JCM 2805 / NCIMB 9133 / AM1) TaxID=272630 RepID=C5B658_METEA|nr:hypothetical protein [Methylorubrum extorquens]ACS43940.1 Hypothetical protein MexAM1_META2p1174 [Methylorubrum extorquens AM1]MCP1546208.1 hypothetical protein [Methylorubrum extorquens]MCP1590875.1 hypothetical protein [Methylorubrum extorquens]
MNITLFREVGRPLTIAEADANIDDLDGRLSALETQGLEATGLQALVFDEVASTITVSLSDGTVFGPFKLPMSAFRPRGDWGAGIAYLVTDLVTTEGGSYVCTASHTACASFQDDLTGGRWMLSAARGPKGKDALDYIGVYIATAIYEPGDVVLVDPDSMQLWRALIRPPAGKGPGTFADDAAHTPYWTPQSYPVFDTEEINHSVRGAFGASSQVFRRWFARSGKFLPNLAGAVGYCDVAPTNAVAFNLTLGGAVPNATGTTIGQLRFAAGSRVAIFTMTANANLGIVPGGQSFVISPSVVDPTLSGLEFAIPYNVIGEAVG